MPWARLEDDYLGNAKLRALPIAAICLDLASIIFSARELRDGHLSVDDVRAISALIHLHQWERAATQLVVARRWALESGGWEIHDYLDYQPSREHVLAERAAGRERQRRKRSDTGQFMPVSRRDSGRTSGVTPGEVPPESGRSHSAPGPGINYRATGSGLAGRNSRNELAEMPGYPRAHAHEEDIPDEVRERLNRPPLGQPAMPARPSKNSGETGHAVG